MNAPQGEGPNNAKDSIQRRFAEYALGLRYSDLPSATVLAAKLRIIDTLGAMVAGLPGEPCRIARALASQFPAENGATILGTANKTSPDMAAFANGTAGRYAELMDVYHWPGSHESHPSDTVLPVLAAAEHAGCNGREYISAVVLAYEVYSRIADRFPKGGFDHTNFGCIATAAASGRVLGLTELQLGHCLSLATVPNNTLREARHATMFKAAAAGQAGRAGVFAAMLARAGMEGPGLPFEGKFGWCKYVANAQFTLTEMGGNGTPYKVEHSFLKNRAAAGITIASILAAEKIAPRSMDDIARITVETHGLAKERAASDSHAWEPATREHADHSIPYLVAITLRDGTIKLESFAEVHLQDPQLRALMKKITVIENPEYTRDYGRHPQANRARVTVVTNSGQEFQGLAGGDREDLAAPRSEAQVSEKFHGLTDAVLGRERAGALLDKLLNLDNMEDVSFIAQYMKMS